jgi:hypothetical protein
MEDLFSFVVFVIIVVASIIGKLISKPKAEEEGSSQPVRPLTLDELPEATRRMLFGDGFGEVIVAKPKHTPVEHEDIFGENLPSKENLPDPVPARQVVWETPRPVVAPFQSHQQTPRPVAVSPLQQPLQRPVPQMPRRQPQVQNRPQPQARMCPQPAAPAVSAQARTAKQAAIASKQRAICPSKNIIALIGSRDGLRNCILAREILGPPRAFDY